MMINPSEVEVDNNGEWRVDCPFCEDNGKTPDTNKHLYINPRKDVYICFRCSEKGKASTDLGLRPDRGVTGELDVEGIIQRIDGPDLTVRRDYVTLKDISKPIKKGFPSHHYLLDRGLTSIEIEKYNIRSGVAECKGRVVVPIFDEKGGCIYYVARSYTGRKPRYKNPSKPKGDAVFNLYQAEGNQIVVCEGVFDAMALNEPAVATMGKDITNNQLALIAIRFNEVYLALDGETVHETKWHRGDEVPMRQYYRDRLLGLGCWTGIVDLPEDEDPDSWGADNMSKAIENTELSEPGLPSANELFQQPRYHN